MSNAEPHADIINIPSGFFACLRNENIYLGHLRYFVFAFWKFDRFLLKSKACKRQKIKSALCLCHKTMQIWFNKEPLSRGNRVFFSIIASIKIVITVKRPQSLLNT